MKLIIHASLFASGSVEVDMDTGQARFLCRPIVNDDQALLTTAGPEIASAAGLRALAELHRAVADAIIQKTGNEKAKLDAIPLVNVVGKGNA